VPTGGARTWRRWRRHSRRPRRPRGPWTGCWWWRSRRGRAGRGRRSFAGRNGVAWWVPSLRLRGEVAGDLFELLVGIALGQLVHDGRGAAPGLERLQLREQVVARHAGQRRQHRAADRAAVGAVAIGASGGKA